MTVSIVHSAPSEKKLQKVVTDCAVNNKFNSIGFGKSSCGFFPSIILSDGVLFAAPSQIYLTKSEPGSWLVFFSIGSGEGALQLQILSVSCILDIYHQLEDVFNYSQVEIVAKRKIFSDSKGIVGASASHTVISTEFLDIKAIRASNLKGSWEDSPNIKNSLLLYNERQYPQRRDLFAEAEQD